MTGNSWISESDSRPDLLRNAISYVYNSSSYTVSIFYDVGGTGFVDSIEIYCDD